MKLSTMREGISVQDIGTLDLRGKLFDVLDSVRQERFLVVIRRVNSRLLPERAARQVVRFSRREHSPRVSDQIRVSTLTRYREDENLKNNQRDSMEGRVRLDATPFYVRCLSERGVGDAAKSLTAQTEYVATPEPWVYCTALCPGSERDAYRLARRISSDYDTITDILDVNAFALELGVAFAVTLDSAVHTKAVSIPSRIWRACAAISPFREVVFVDHGPVVYEDNSGTLDTGREVDELASRAGFIKPASFSYQSEYRFALTTIGEPSIRTLPVPVSDELRECTSLRRTASGRAPGGRWPSPASLQPLGARVSSYR